MISSLTVVVAQGVFLQNARVTVYFSLRHDKGIGARYNLLLRDYYYNIRLPLVIRLLCALEIR